jgi:hypothetical protein
MSERDLRTTRTGGRTTPSGSPPRRVASSGALVALAVGLALGGLTDEGQHWLPWAASSLANSGGSWVLVSFVVALAAGTVGRAVVRGGAALVGLVIGYYVVAALRGVPVGASSVEFWVVAALVIGPLVGLAAGWVRHGQPSQVAVGAGTVGGLLVGEAAYSLRFLSGSTSATYWSAQFVLGLSLMLALLVWRARRLTSGAVMLLTAGAMGTITIAVYLGG